MKYFLSALFWLLMEAAVMALPSPAYQSVTLSSGTSSGSLTVTGTGPGANLLLNGSVIAGGGGMPELNGTSVNQTLTGTILIQPTGAVTVQGSLSASGTFLGGYFSGNGAGLYGVAATTATNATTSGSATITGSSVVSGSATASGSSTVSGTAGYSGSTGNIVFSGSVTSVAVLTSGSLYFPLPPSVNFSGGGGSGAAATANVSGGSPYNVTSITVTNGGSGYTSPPTANISGGAGAGATAGPVTLQSPLTPTIPGSQITGTVPAATYALTGPFISAITTPSFFFQSPVTIASGTASLVFNTNFTTNGFPYATGSNSLGWGVFGSNFLLSGGTLSCLVSATANSVALANVTGAGTGVLTAAALAVNTTGGIATYPAGSAQVTGTSTTDGLTVALTTSAISLTGTPNVSGTANVLASTSGSATATVSGTGGIAFTGSSANQAWSMTLSGSGNAGLTLSGSGTGTSSLVTIPGTLSLANAGNANIDLGPPGSSVPFVHGDNTPQVSLAYGVSGAQNVTWAGGAWYSYQANLGRPSALQWNNLYINQIIGQSATPSIITSGGIGTSGSATIVGTNLSGVITFYTGTSPSASTVITTSTFAGAFAFPTNSVVVLQNESATDTVLSVPPYVTTTANSFSINAGGTALTGATTYVYGYHVTGY